MNYIDRLQRTALHECCHALFAHGRRFEVLSIKASPGNGVTTINLPFAASELPAYFRADPGPTYHKLLDIIGTLLAPAVAMHEAPYGGDASDLALWQHVWEKCRFAHAGASWPTILDLAAAKVRGWLQAPGRETQLAWLADELAKRRVVTGPTWRSLVERQRQAAQPAPRATTPVSPQRPTRRNTARDQDLLEREEVLPCGRDWRGFGGGLLVF
jgi:hypothetical protein